MDKDALKKKLSKQQYDVLVDRGTETPYSGELLYNKENGIYTCPICSTPLFKSEDKYDSDTPGLLGWPSFNNAIDENVELKPDNSLGMNRTEVVCKVCGGHLGHLFDDPSSSTGKHYCINSCSLDFKPTKK